MGLVSKCFTSREFRPWKSANQKFFAIRPFQHSSSFSRDWFCILVLGKLVHLSFASWESHEL